MGLAWLAPRTLETLESSRLPGDLPDVVVGVLDTGDVGVDGQSEDQVGVHVDTRADTGVRVDDDWDGGGVGDLSRGSAVFRGSCWT
jgi:hypothetical protein